MKRAIVTLVLLCSCYKKSDAVKQLTDMGRPSPITCVHLNGNDGDAAASFFCVDGLETQWFCDNDGCVKVKK